jgi:hypothetical protein
MVKLLWSLRKDDIVKKWYLMTYLYFLHKLFVENNIVQICIFELTKKLNGLE